MRTHRRLIFLFLSLHLERTEDEINEELIIKLIVVLCPVKLLLLKSQDSLIDKTCVKANSEKLISILMPSKVTSSNEDVSFDILIHWKDRWEVRTIVLSRNLSNIQRAKDHLFSLEDLYVRRATGSFQPCFLGFLFVFLILSNSSSNKRGFNIWDAIHDDSLQSNDSSDRDIPTHDIPEVAQVSLVAGKKGRFGINPRDSTHILQSFQRMIKPIVDKGQEATGNHQWPSFRCLAVNRNHVLWFQI